MDTLNRVSAMLAALGSLLRLQIIRILETGDYHVHEIVAELGKSQPLVSQHLKVLKDCGLVESERCGREVIYRLAGPHVSAMVDHAWEVASDGQSPAGMTFIRNDA